MSFLSVEWSLRAKKEIMLESVFDKTPHKFSLAGHIIVSTPYMEGGTCFSKSVILILTHDKNGTLGVIVNRVITSVRADFLFKSLNLEIDANKFNAPIHFGGPVESEKGIILHTNDYSGKALLNIENNISLSSNVDILKDIAAGHGPRNNLLVLGYSGWAPGQIESEIKKNVWIPVPFSESLIFLDSNEDKWDIAINSIGISSSNFSSSFGRA